MRGDARRPKTAGQKKLKESSTVATTAIQAEAPRLLTKLEKGSIEFAAQVSAEEAADYLEAIANACREGSALLESGDKSLSIEVGRDVKVELEAQTDPSKGKGSIDLSLSWRVAEQAETPPSLVIVAGPPAPAAEED
jgi:amphi-Trp domain-containing protein